MRNILSKQNLCNKRASIPPLVFNNKPRKDTTVVPDAMVSFAKQHKPPKDLSREAGHDPYYYDARV